MSDSVPFVPPEAPREEGPDVAGNALAAPWPASGSAEAYAEALEAQRRTERLQAVTAALSRAATAEAVADVLMHEGMEASGALRGVVLGLRADGSSQIVRHFGFVEGEERERAFRVITVDCEPLLRRAAESRRTQWLPSWEAVMAEVPELAVAGAVLLPDGARAILPLVTEQRVWGFLALAWDRARDFPGSERSFLEALAHQCGQALERTSLYEELHARGERLRLALQQGKEAEERLSFLLDASRTLSEHLDDVEWTLEHVARLAARTVATCCRVDLAVADGELRCVAACHREPEKDAAVLVGLAAPHRDQGLSPSQACFESGAPLLLSGAEAVARGAGGEGSEHLARLAVLGLESLLAVPVRLRGRMLGVITLGTATPQRRLDAVDVTMVEELGRRVAVALENANLYRNAQAAVRLRDEFLSIASHELKTPLTSLKLQHGLIERYLSGESRERLGPRLSTAMRQVQRLTALVDGLLDVSRLSLGKLALEPTEVDLSQAIHDAVERMSEVFHQSRCEVLVQARGPLVGRWDALRLDQVLINLLSNAAKYGAGRPVRVEAMLEAMGDAVRLTVRDEGIGISPEDLPRLFGRFERAVSQRHYGGLGLGLYISRQIIEAMGGRIEVESEPSRGSTFTVHLPRGVAP